MRTPPYPLQKALSMKPAVLPELIEHVVEGDHDIYYERCGSLFRAMVAGPHASKECPGSTVKCFRADCFETLQSEVVRWLGEQ